MTLSSERRKTALLTHRKALERIRLFATDVDGVLTDGGMYYSESGEELKKFHTRDGMGIKLLQAEGIITAIITMENTKLVSRRAEKLGIAEIHQGATDKLAVLCGLAQRYRITLQEIAYMGDDINDLDALRAVGFSGAPADCVDAVRRVVHYVCRQRGGAGAVREVAELILEARNVHPP